MNRGHELEFHDQMERQTMSFNGMAAALESDALSRTIKIVFAPEENFCPTIRTHRDVQRATEIAREIERSFSGLKITGQWLRRVIHRTDGVLIGAPSVDAEKGAVECTILVEPTANYDAVHQCITRILESQPDFEPRGGSVFFTRREADAIERMPKEEILEATPNLVTVRETAAEAAKTVLQAYVYRRGE